MTQYRLVSGDETIEISQADFESAREDRDELFRQLELESWFAEVGGAVLSWQEKMMRFASRWRSEELDRFVHVQIECELTSRMTNIVVATNGLRRRIDKEHTDCQNKAACDIAQGIRDSWTHTSTRLLSATVGSEDLWLSAPQIGSMPTNGNRERVELHIKGEEILPRDAGQRRALQQAIAGLFPDGDIDLVTVLNSHIACTSRSMAAYRTKAVKPGTFRDSLLARYKLTGKSHVYITCGAEDVHLGSPFGRMLEDVRELRKRHREVATFELVQFGRGEFRAGSLDEARDYTLELAAGLGFDSKNTEEVADALDLGNGYEREALCKDAPPLFRDAVEQVYSRARSLPHALLWAGFALRLLPRRLRGYKSRTSPQT